MPCRYICAFWDGFRTGYRIRGEDDGTPCRVNGNEGACWYGACLTRYGEQDQQFQEVDNASKIPRHIRKRDVTAVKGSVTTKSTTVSDGGSDYSTKSVSSVKTVKSTSTDDGSLSTAKGAFSTPFPTSFSSSTNTKGAPSDLNLGNQFSVKGVGSQSHATNGFFSMGGSSPDGSKTVNNGVVKISVRRGPNGEQVTTRTTRKYVIRRGPTTTVRRIIIKQSSAGASNGFMPGSVKRIRIHRLGLQSAPAHGRIGLVIGGGNTGVKTKTSQITVKTVTMPRNPITSVVRTVTQQRISGGQNLGGSLAATKTVSTVAVTKKVQPSISAGQITSHGLTPSTSASLETEKTAALKGLEVEVPGYTAGLRQNWKWVLARRVGMYPPYVQVIDPDVLFYKLGLRKPYIPALPVPVQDVLNRVPVHPVGSDLYGFLLSSKILEKIRGFTDRLNGLSKLNGMLSTANTSQLQISNLLQNLFTSGRPSPSGLNLLQKIMLASFSQSGNNPLTSPYGGLLSSPYGTLFGGAYTGQYGSPLAGIPGGSFPGSSWPAFGRTPTQLGSFVHSPSDYTSSSFGLYDSAGTPTNPSDESHTLLEEESILPSAATLESRNVEHLLRNPRYLKALLAPRVRVPDGQYGLQYDDEKIAAVLARKKLHNLLRIPRTRDSILRKILHVYAQQSSHGPSFLQRPNSLHKKRVDEQIIYELLRKASNGRGIRPSRYKPSYGTEPENTDELVSKLRYILGKSNDETAPYHSTFRTESQVTELLNALGRRPRASRYSPVYSLVQALKHRQHEGSSRVPLDSPDVTEQIEDLITSSGGQPASERPSDIRKVLAKVLLSSGQAAVPTEGRRSPHVSKLVSVHRTSHTEARPQGVAASRVISATYQTNKGTVTGPISFSPLTTSPLQGTNSVIQQSMPANLLAMNSFSTNTNAAPQMQAYMPFVPQPVYPMEGNGLSSQAAMVDHQFASSTGSVYGSPLSAPATTMMTGTRYSGYAALPTSTAYVSQYATQPYYLGTSMYGGHPHYVVEGHEAPGTRWQLRVWRHQPGVASVAPGFTSFGSSHLGSVVTRARETVTRGLTPAGHFGFTTYGASVPGGVSGWSGGASQYVVNAPDGSLLVSRQPLSYSSPSAGVVVTQTTKQTTKTSGSPLTTATGGLPTSLFPGGLGGEGSKISSTESKFETIKQQISTAGTGKTESVPELSQNKESSLFSELASGSGSDRSGSSTSTAGSSSGSLLAESDLSQSKVRR